MQTSWEATLGATGFLLLFEAKCGSGECGLLPGALFGGATWSELGFFWLLGGECGAGECGLLSGTPFVVATCMV